MGLRIAIVGATGNVGREMLSILSERGFKSNDIFAIASNRRGARERIQAFEGVCIGRRNRGLSGISFQLNLLEFSLANFPYSKYFLFSNNKLIEE